MNSLCAFKYSFFNSQNAFFENNFPVLSVVIIIFITNVQRSTQQFYHILMLYLLEQPSPI